MPRAHGVGDFIDPEASLQPSLSDLNRWSPMPTPNYHEMRSEACCGCTVVLGMIGGLVSLTQIYALNSTAPFSSDDPLRVCHLLTWLRCPSVAAAAAAVAAAHDQGAAAAAAGKAGITRVIHGAVRRCGGAGSEWWHIVGSIIYVEAVVALVCLGGLMWGDPGTLKRSAERCFPLPEEVRRRLMGNPSVPSGRPACPEVGSIAGMPNITESRAGRTETFCTRCMIWRPNRPNIHHCSTCQRCVVDFDHHCGVFGRCIAGEGMRGNMGYFKTIICMGFAGVVTCGVATLAKAANEQSEDTG